MLSDTFANRLQKALDLNDWKPVDLINKTGIDKSLISNYLSGKYKAGQDNLTTLADALNVDETWLIGYDVPIIGISRSEKLDEVEILYNKYKNEISDDDKEHILFILNKYKRKIDEQLGEK